MSPTPHQRALLLKAEKELGLGPVALAGELGVSYSTYRCWKNESRGMPPVAWRCLELVKIARLVQCFSEELDEANQTALLDVLLAKP